MLRNLAERVRLEHDFLLLLLGRHRHDVGKLRLVLVEVVLHLDGNCVFCEVILWDRVIRHGQLQRIDVFARLHVVVSLENADLQFQVLSKGVRKLFVV